MLSLSQTSGYGILALGCLDSSAGGYLQAKDIAACTGVPLPYLSKLLHILATYGLVASKRGYQGGFHLVRPAEQISLLDIAEAVEGKNWCPKCLLGLEVWRPSWSLVGSSWDYRFDPVRSQPAADSRVAVALVPRQALGTLARSADRSGNRDAVHHCFDLRRFVPSAGRDFDRQGKASAVSNQVERAAPSALRAAQSVVLGLLRVLGETFFEAPPAARAARTDEPSMHHRSQSIRPSRSRWICRAERMRPYAWAGWVRPFAIVHPSVHIACS